MTTLTTLSTAPPAPARHLATRATCDDVRAFPRVLRSDWVKLSSLRASRALPVLTVAVGAFTSWAVATLVTDQVLVVSDVFVFSTVLTAMFAAVAGILLFTGEAQHGTLAATLTAQPARWVVAASKTVTAAGVGLVLGAAGLAAGTAGAVAGGLDMGDTSGMAATAGWALVFTAMTAVLGLGVGMVVRHASGAISGMLGWWLVAENLLALFVPARFVRFFPFFAGNALLDLDPDNATAETIAVALTRPQDALVLGAYTAVALLAGAVLLYRRDTN